jgi:hypothetical protein
MVQGRKKITINHYFHSLFACYLLPVHYSLSFVPCSLCLFLVAYLPVACCLLLAAEFPFAFLGLPACCVLPVACCRISFAPFTFLFRKNLSG